ncbi:hypothetical protein GW17_00014593, partial [Ensete ventricosum]
PITKKKAAALPGRAWRQSSVALLWTRKSGVFRIFLASALFRLPQEFDKFSFEETPVFHFNFKTPSVRLLRIPCITPAAELDTDDDDLVFAKLYRNSYLLDKHETKEASGVGCEDDDDDDNAVRECEDHAEMEEEDEIDRKAEQFIAKFYQQMKMQRQISLLQYNEMLHRGVN